MFGQVGVARVLFAIACPHVIGGALYFVVVVLGILDELLQILVVDIHVVELLLEHFATHVLLHMLEALGDNVHRGILERILAHTQRGQAPHVGQFVGQSLQLIVFEEQRAQVVEIGQARSWQLGDLIIAQLE